MTQVLEISGKEFKITIKMLKALVEKVDRMQEQVGNVSRGMEIQGESKRNARDKKHCNRNEECL